MKISDQIRATWVKRWGIVRTLREQNVAEHSFMVAMISTELMGRIGFPITGGGGLQGARCGEVLLWALWHDMAEVSTGDLPTPHKLAIRAKAGDLLQQIEDDIFPEVAAIRNNTGTMVREVVKIADYLEAISFLRREGHGPEAAGVGDLLTNQLVAYISDWNSLMRRHYGAVRDMAKDMGVDLPKEPENVMPDESVQAA